MSRPATRTLSDLGLHAADPLPFTGRPWYAALVLATALALTAAATAVLMRAIQRTDQDRFTSAVDGMEERIVRRMDTYIAMLRGEAGLIDSGGGPDGAALRTYVAHLDLRAQYPGIQGLGWIGRVKRGEEDVTERWLRGQGVGAADATPHLWPEAAAGGGDERYPVLLLEPQDERNQVAIGFDVASEPQRRLALERARDSGEPMATAPLALVTEVAEPRQPGFLILLPVYGRAASDATARRAALRGFVYAPFRCHDLFHGIFGRRSLAPLAITVHDGGETQGGSLLFRSTDDPEAAVARPDCATTRTLTVAGRPWTVGYAATTLFDAESSRWLIPWFTAAGVLLSLGLYSLARLQTRAVAANAGLYRASMAAHREAEINLGISRRLASGLDLQAVAQAVTDAGRELTGAAFGAFCGPARDGVLHARALSGQPPPDFASRALPRLAPLFAPTIVGQEPVRLADARSDPRYAAQPAVAQAVTQQSADAPLVASYLAVPVRSRTGEVLGGLLYAHPQPDRFTAGHERVLLGLAAQAAIAIDNARLLDGEREARRTAAHRAEDLTRTNAELQQFVYVSSHDLQEPLRTVTQYLDLLQRRHATLLDDEARRYIAYASDSAARMYLLLNDLLTYARLGRAAERESVDFNDLFDEVLQDLHATIAESGAQITAGRLPVVRCERSKLRLVLQNLIGNALKFRSGGSPRIAITAVDDGRGTWTFAVADNGIGISSEHHAIIFEVFERLHDRAAFPGTGIGLAICRKVVEQHGGRIWVESRPDEGATFRFTLVELGSQLQTAIVR